MTTLTATISSNPWTMTVRTGSPIDFRGIADRADLASVIRAALGPPRTGGRWVCPFHEEAENAHLGVDRNNRRWTCFRCGATGSVLDWIVRHDGLTIVEAARK